ncbi:MAG TPA: metalloregulator ArsR/SmtB family transcription factor [Dietzia timorensis]|uniref:Metalloregulator ArsR/SmtB family transcription factor n=1 Tax=Dietzia timorensis TaxID=499555 RepID=A0A921JY38_9ACTN|nr:metalloregulator ArsR/SmtB family transcription factor [Dietzia timorensis]HJE90875.1 metalloregulator ArsR/SmtB family transcription factor [Dietzia timorensis]
MAKHSDELDTVLIALADPTRRSIIRLLGAGPATVGTLAEPFDITLPSFMKHIRSLERAGVIHTSKSGRVRTCELDRARLSIVDDWLADERALWNARTDRLEQMVTNPEEPS